MGLGSVGEFLTSSADSPEASRRSQKPLHLYRDGGIREKRSGELKTAFTADMQQCDNRRHGARDGLEFPFQLLVPTLLEKPNAVPREPGAQDRGSRHHFEFARKNTTFPPDGQNVNKISPIPKRMTLDRYLPIGPNPFPYLRGDSSASPCSA
ncbi:unnamed protein product [Penicillium roqueforti FM164]|uniref:Uncharacterized protein n=1 Tax=Penicillium roqueforti (strain FM164) TaxID=1365484 RepID=W6QVY6_PENRF|nr:unnamed protein product [Penicillium roqueforti FM164]